jgi:hypothetical protein
MMLLRAKTADSAKALPLLAPGVLGPGEGGAVPNCWKARAALHSVLLPDALKDAWMFAEEYVVAGKYFAGEMRLLMV